MTRLSVLAGLLAVSLSACQKEQLPELPPPPLLSVPDDSVEYVIFWVGDAGKAEWGRTPLVHRLAAEIDRYSRIIARDSAVGVIFLGDNVYPGGLRNEPGRKEFLEDSTHLEAQVNVMRAPYTRRYNSFAVFLAGNHDWGHKFNEEGRRRLRAQEEFLARRRAAGVNVIMLPPAATPGPSVIDIGRHLRIIILDTAWWLLAPDVEDKAVMMQQIEDAMRTAAPRQVVIATHHPYRSASSHGGLQPFWAGLGIRWLLSRSGAALQDLNSLPYRDLLDRLKGIFERTGPPLLFAGGHDHVLQVLQKVEDLDPAFMLVSGSGSKLSSVAHTEGMLFRAAEPGYMRLIVKTNGQIALFVDSAPEDFLHCDARDPARIDQCLQAGIQSFRTRWGARIH